MTRVLRPLGFEGMPECILRRCLARISIVRDNDARSVCHILLSELLQPPVLFAGFVTLNAGICSGLT
jgi:hypothetical protein